MLYRPTLPDATASPYYVKDVTGRNVAHAHRTPSQRAGLAAQLVLGEAALIKPTRKQVARLLRVSGPHVAFRSAGLELACRQQRRTG
jgi:hypothetical protein